MDTAKPWHPKRRWGIQDFFEEKEILFLRTKSKLFWRK
jgi:hypothetical protein